MAVQICVVRGIEACLSFSLQLLNVASQTNLMLHLFYMLAIMIFRVSVSCFTVDIYLVG